MTRSGPTTRSHTQYQMYTECSWRYYLKYLRNIPEQPAVWLAGGTAVHAAYELIAREVWARGAALDIENTLPDAEDRFSSVLEQEFEAMRAIEPDEAKWRTAGRKWGKPDTTAQYPNGQDEEWWREHAPAMIQGLIDWWTTNATRYGVYTLPDGTPAIECGDVADYDTYKVRYHPDIVMFDMTHGTLVLVDWKTGKEMPATPHQLGEYAVWFEKQYGIKVWYGSHFDARKGELEQPRLLDMWTPKRVDHMFSELDRAVEERIFLPRVSKDCVMCGFKRACQFSPDYAGD